MNRNFSEPGWPEAPSPSKTRSGWPTSRNVYEIIDRLRAKHPEAGNRVLLRRRRARGPGILTRVEEVWTSDNTDAFDRLRIQEGFSYAYTPKAMMAWVTDVPNYNGRSTPLQYRFLVAMMGSLGIGGNLNKWSGDDLALATRMVTLYKSIRKTVQEGRLYRLFSPQPGTFSATQYVAEDGRQAVLFAFRSAQHFGYPPPTVRLCRSRRTGPLPCQNDGSEVSGEPRYGQRRVPDESGRQPQADRGFRQHRPRARTNRVARGRRRRAARPARAYFDCKSTFLTTVGPVREIRP